MRASSVKKAHVKSYRDELRAIYSSCSPLFQEAPPSSSQVDEALNALVRAVKDGSCGTKRVVARLLPRLALTYPEASERAVEPLLALSRDKRHREADHDYPCQAPAAAVEALAGLTLVFGAAAAQRRDSLLSSIVAGLLGRKAAAEARYPSLRRMSQMEEGELWEGDDEVEVVCAAVRSCVKQAPGKVLALFLSILIQPEHKLSSTVVGFFRDDLLKPEPPLRLLEEAARDLQGEPRAVDPAAEESSSVLLYVLRGAPELGPWLAQQAARVLQHLKGGKAEGTAAEVLKAVGEMAGGPIDPLPRPAASKPFTPPRTATPIRVVELSSLAFLASRAAFLRQLMPAAAAADAEARKRGEAAAAAAAAAAAEARAAAAAAAAEQKSRARAAEDGSGPAAAQSHLKAKPPTALPPVPVAALAPSSRPKGHSHTQGNGSGTPDPLSRVNSALSDTPLASPGTGAGVGDIPPFTVVRQRPRAIVDPYAAPAPKEPILQPPQDHPPPAEAAAPAPGDAGPAAARAVGAETPGAGASTGLPPLLDIQLASCTLIFSRLRYGMNEGNIERELNLLVGRGAPPTPRDRDRDRRGGSGSLRLRIFYTSRDRKDEFLVSFPTLRDAAEVLHAVGSCPRGELWGDCHVRFAAQEPAPPARGAPRDPQAFASVWIGAVRGSAAEAWVQASLKETGRDAEVTHVYRVCSESGRLPGLVLVFPSPTIARRSTSGLIRQWLSAAPRRTHPGRSLRLVDMVGPPRELAAEMERQCGEWPTSIEGPRRPGQGVGYCELPSVQAAAECRAMLQGARSNVAGTFLRVEFEDAGCGARDGSPGAVEDAILFRGSAAGAAVDAATGLTGRKREREGSQSPARNSRSPSAPGPSAPPPPPAIDRTHLPPVPLPQPSPLMVDGAGAGIGAYDPLAPTPGMDALASAPAGGTLRAPAASPLPLPLPPAPSPSGPSWVGRLLKGGTAVSDIVCRDHPSDPTSRGPPGEPLLWPGVLSVERRCDRQWLLGTLLPLVPPGERAVRRIVCGTTSAEEKRLFIGFLQGLADRVKVAVVELPPTEPGADCRTLYLIPASNSVCETLKVTWEPREMLVGLVVRDSYVREGMASLIAQIGGGGAGGAE